jgi:kynurenine 3-monooxygenase
LPYREALAKGNHQENIMQHIMGLPQIEQRWNDPDIMETMLALLKK